ncbi:MAG: DUF2974 domain-containing protein, partial [Ruminococcus sp.]|nr:DUF2974 domain-containing protein [Ruminococcus sp.]
MYLTDEELCMLEQLVYLDEDVARAAGISEFFSKINIEQHGDKSIAKILEDFNDAALVKLMAYNESVCDGAISGTEWVKIISYLKNPENQISRLVLRDMYTTPNLYHAAVKDELTGEYVGIADYHAFVWDYNQGCYVSATDYRQKYNTEIPIEDLVIRVSKAYENDDDSDRYDKDSPYYLPYLRYAEIHETPVIGNTDCKRFPLALCFTDGFDTNEAIIAYKGTTGQEEWADNVNAAMSESTPPQEKALDFAMQMVERGFTELTVTGHSKGSNKAMYTALLCDNVVRCVSFDGQGFSDDFFRREDVAQRIEKRASLITNYSLAADFVHILLYQIPGSNQLFCEGFGVDGIMENHSSNSFFAQADFDNLVTRLYNDTELTRAIYERLCYDEHLVKLISSYAYRLNYGIVDESNIWEFLFRMIRSYGKEVERELYDAISEYSKPILNYCNNGLFLNNNSPVFVSTSEASSVAMINEFVTYLVSLEGGSKDLVQFISSILPKALPNQTDDGFYFESDMLNDIIENRDMIERLVGHLVLFLKEKKFSYDDALDICTQLCGFFPNRLLFSDIAVGVPYLINDLSSDGSLVNDIS